MLSETGSGDAVRDGEADILCKYFVEDKVRKVFAPDPKSMAFYKKETSHIE